MNRFKIWIYLFIYFFCSFFLDEKRTKKMKTWIFLPHSFYILIGIGESPLSVYKKTRISSKKIPKIDSLRSSNHFVRFRAEM